VGLRDPVEDTQGDAVGGASVVGLEGPKEEGGDLLDDRAVPRSIDVGDAKSDINEDAVGLEALGAGLDVRRDAIGGLEEAFGIGLGHRGVPGLHQDHVADHGFGGFGCRFARRRFVLGQVSEELSVLCKVRVD